MRQTAQLALCLYLSFVSSACSAADRPVNVSLSGTQWQEDLDHLARELPRRHVGPFERVSHEEWNRAVKEFRGSIPELTADRVVIGFGRIVALLGDGHTELIPFQRGTQFRRLPLVFHFFGSDTRIVAVAPGHESLLGAQVIAIGGRPIEALREALRPFVARDNDSELLHSGPEYLATPEILAALGAWGSTGPVALSLVSQEGDREQVAVPASSRDALRQVQWINAREQAGVEAPLASQNLSKDYWYRYMEENRLLFVKYNRCRDQDGEPKIRRFARSLSDFTEAHPVERLVVDLRHNAGGDNKKNAPLIETITRWKSMNAGGRVFVLVGRMTFSAAMDAAIRLAKETEAVFVGEPPRGRPNTVGDMETLTLPRSGLRVDYSTKRYSRMPELADAAYLPIDLPTESGWVDFISGRDPALEAVLDFGGFQQTGLPE